MPGDEPSARGAATRSCRERVDILCARTTTALLSKCAPYHLSVTDFEQPVQRHPLTADVVNRRRRAASAAVEVGETLDPRIERHLATFQAAVGELARTHAEIIDQSDLDLTALTRSVAVWELSGRAISLANALIDQLGQGYGPQTIGTTRLMFEAVTVLEALTEAPEAIVKKWLDGGHIPVSEARKHIVNLAERGREAALEANEALESNPQYLAIVAAIEADDEYKRFVAQRAREGDPVEGIGVIVEFITRGEYKELSHERGGHNDRGGFSLSCSSERRQFVYGPHPDPCVRAKYVDVASHDIERVVIVVGYSFARFFLGPNYQREAIELLKEGLAAARGQAPLDEEAIARLRVALPFA